MSGYKSVRPDTCFKGRGRLYRFGVEGGDRLLHHHHGMEHPGVRESGTRNRRSVLTLLSLNRLV